jgi:hypothetical protein
MDEQSPTFHLKSIQSDREMAQSNNRKADYKSEIISELDDALNNEAAQRQNQLQQFPKTLRITTFNNNSNGAALRRQQSNRSL